MRSRFEEQAMMDIGINPGALTYFTANPFLNRFKTAGVWNDPATKAVITGPFDADGYLTAMPAGVGIVQAIFGMDPGETRPTDDFVVTYKGKGTIRIAAGGTAKSTEPGRIAFTANKPTQGTAILQILAIDPTDPIRDIAIVRADEVDLYAAGKIFRPDYVAKFAGMKALRFMDWLDTNGTFNGHVPVSRYSYGKPSHAPVEICVALANEVGARPWLPLHWDGDDAYDDAFLAKAKPAKLKPIVEKGNEIWNTGFPATVRAAAQALTMWPALSSKDDRARAAQSEYGYRVGQLAIKARGMGVDVVIGTQPTSPELASFVFQGFDASGAKNGDIAYWSMTYYINGTLTKKTGPAVDMMNADDVAGALNNMLTQTEGRGVPAMAGYYQAQAKIGASRGWPLICYEGGYHLRAVSLNERADWPAIEAPLVKFFTKVQRDPGSAAVYDANLDVLEKAGCVLACAFNLDGGPSEFGIFGHYGTPAWDVLQARIKANAKPTLDELLAELATVQGDLATALATVQSGVDALRVKIGKALA
jgi:hypothetical protein